MFASMARGSLAYKWARYFGAAARTKVVSTATANHTRTVRPSPLTKLLCSVDTRVALAEFRRGQARRTPDGFDLIFNQFPHFFSDGIGWGKHRRRIVNRQCSNALTLFCSWFHRAIRLEQAHIPTSDRKKLIEECPISLQSDAQLLRRNVVSPIPLPFET